MSSACRCAASGRGRSERWEVRKRRRKEAGVAGRRGERSGQERQRKPGTDRLSAGGNEKRESEVSASPKD